MSEDKTECARAYSAEVALLRRFIAGEKLPAAEAAGLAHLLPAAVLANPPRPRASYQHELKHYAPALGVAVRPVKRWIGIGKDAQPRDLPPLDDPPRLLPWWEKMFAAGLIKQRPPQAVLNYSRPAASIESAVPPLATPGASAPPLAPAASTADGSLTAAVARLRATLEHNQRRLDDAMRAKPLDEGLVASLSRLVEKGIDLLRKADTDLFEMQKKRGDLVPLKDVREDWSTLLMSQKMMRARMVDNVTAQLAGVLPPEHLELVRQAVTLERTREDQLLRGARHWKESPDVSPIAAAA